MCNNRIRVIFIAKVIDSTIITSNLLWGLDVMLYLIHSISWGVIIIITIITIITVTYTIDYSTNILAINLFNKLIICVRVIIACNFSVSAINVIIIII